MDTTLPAEPKVRGLSEVPFEFLSAKLHGRRSALYEGARLADLAAFDSVQELAYHLYPRADIHDAVGLERQLIASCVAELAHFLRYLSGAYESLYVALLGRYAVDNLKVLLRLLGREDAEAQAERLLTPLPAELFLPVESLMSADGVGEFVGRIPLREVRDAALAAMPLYEETGQGALLEMALDRGHWAAVGAAVARLPGPARTACSPPLARELDSMRVLAALRAARVYGMSWERVALLLPPGWGDLSDGAVREIHSRPEVGTVLERLPWLRGALPESEAAEAPIGRIEDAFMREVDRAADRQYYAPYSEWSGPVILVSYFCLKRRELRRMVSLVQMVSRGTPRADVLAALGL